MTTLRRTTTPSAELDKTTGGRFTAPGLTITTGFGVACGAAARTAGAGVAAAAAATAAGISGCACATAASTTSGGLTGGRTIAGSPRAAKNALMRGSCSPRVSSLIIDLCSCCISARTASSGALGSYSCFFDDRIVPSKNRCVFSRAYP